MLHGAVLTAEDGEVRTGADVVIMKNALVRGRRRHPALIGNACSVPVQPRAFRASSSAYDGHHCPATGPPRQVPSDSPGRLTHR